LADLAPFGANFDGGVAVAAGDLDCDQRDGVAVATASGVPRVALLDVDEDDVLAVVGQLAVFDGESVDGATVAVGDVDGDGSGDLVVGAGPGGAPRVEVYPGLVTQTNVVGGIATAPIVSSTVFDAGFTGGVTVATIDDDDDDDGDADIAVAQTSGGAEIRLLSGTDLSDPANAPGPEVRWGTLSLDPAATSAVVAGGRFGPLTPLSTDPVTSWAVVGAGPTNLPLVAVADRDGVVQHSFFGFSQLSLGGVAVATGDISGDGVEDIVVGARSGVAQVRVVDGTRLDDVDGTTGEIAPTALLADFVAFPAAYTGGVDVATGDVDGDGRVDVVIGAASGQAQVRVIDGTRVDQVTGVVDDTTPDAVIADLFAFPLAYTAGVNLATGDLDGDPRADIVVGSREGLADVRVIAGARAEAVDGVAGAADLLADFFAYDLSETGGAQVAAGDLTGDGRDELVVGTGPDSLSLVRIFDGATLDEGEPTETALLANVAPFGLSFFGGMRVAVASGLDGDADLGVIALADSDEVRLIEGAAAILTDGPIDDDDVLASIVAATNIVEPDLAFVTAPDDGRR
ncbi:MAG: hypothetical protein AAF211_26095, partial [Myxococcota bacterium]